MADPRLMAHPVPEADIGKSQEGILEGQEVGAGFGSYLETPASLGCSSRTEPRV